MGPFIVTNLSEDYHIKFGTNSPKGYKREANDWAFWDTDS